MVTRRPFAGGYVFAWRCPGNHANYIQALVFAADPQGRDARLLSFPGPGRSAPQEELANVRWFAHRREITSLSVNPEDDRVCRVEARWRLVGGAPQPRLIFWRETPDCAGKRGWRVRVRR